MATYSITGIGTAGHQAHKNIPYLMDVVIDFSSTTNAAADVFQALSIPADTVVLNAGIDVLTVDAAGNSGTVALGDGSVTYVAATAPTTATALTSGDAVAEMFVCYATANTLDVTVATGEIDAKIRVWALVCDYSNPSAAQVVTFA